MTTDVVHGHEDRRWRQTHLVSKLLSQLHGYREEQEDIIYPRDCALRLVPHESRHVLVVDDVVDGQDQLEALQVEGQGQFARQWGLKTSLKDERLDGMAHVSFSTTNNWSNHLLAIV